MTRIRSCWIPLRNDRSEIVAFTVVDSDDYERVISSGTWCFDAKNGYVFRGRQKGENGPKMIKLHRFVLGLGLGDPDVDHIDFNKLDNRKRNLRVSDSKGKNQQNLKPRVGGTSKYRGVYYNKIADRWIASGYYLGKNKSVACCRTEEDANQAVMKWRSEHMPFSQEALHAD